MVRNGEFLARPASTKHGGRKSPSQLPIAPLQVQINNVLALPVINFQVHPMDQTRCAVAKFGETLVMAARSFQLFTANINLVSGSERTGQSESGGEINRARTESLQ